MSTVKQAVAAPAESNAETPDRKNPDRQNAGPREHRREDNVDLYEYQGKQYFARFGIPTSPGGVADTVDEAVAQAEAAGYPVVVKAQVKVGGRGKAGGIKLANDADEVRQARRGDPRHGHQGPHRAPGLGRARLGHRQGVLRQLHPRPRRPSSTSACSRPRAGSRSRRWRPPTPTPSPGSTSTRSTGSTSRRPPRRWVAEAGLDEEARDAGGRAARLASTTATSRATATWPRSTR